MDRLEIKKTDECLYKFIGLSLKLAKKNYNYYKLYKVGNELYFHADKYALKFSSKNEILGNTTINCANGEYKIYKGLNNSYLIVSDIEGELDTDLCDVINMATKNLERICSLSLDDTYRMHELCNHVMMADEDLEIVNYYGEVSVNKSDELFVLVNSEQDRTYNILNTTHVLVGFN